jgi:imidazolonepropionase-like amidohydrolase
MAAGQRSGIAIDDAIAIRWITLNPARALGIDDRTGSLEVGKMADVVIWDGNPFSVYSHAEQVFVDGALTYDRNDPTRQARSDFTLGVLEVNGVIE